MWPWAMIAQKLMRLLWTKWLLHPMWDMSLSIILDLNRYIVHLPRLARVPREKLTRDVATNATAKFIYPLPCICPRTRWIPDLVPLLMEIAGSFAATTALMASERPWRLEINELPN